jgi:hypothetical protein
MNTWLVFIVNHIYAIVYVQLNVIKSMSNAEVSINSVKSDV